MALPKRCNEWGFDLTDFASDKSWKGLLKRNGCKSSGKIIQYGPEYPDHYRMKYPRWFWKCGSGIEFTTEHEGKATKARPDFEGFVGYVGIEFTDRAKLKFDKFRKDFKKTAEYIKGESRCRNDFIDPPSRMRREKRYD